MTYFSCQLIYPATPIVQRLKTYRLIGLGYSHFAHHYFGNHFCFIFLQLLRCFSSLSSLLTLYYDCSTSNVGNTSPTYWVSPFGNLGFKCSCAANPSLSQLVTSFFGMKCQGIHHTLLISPITVNCAFKVF